MILEKLKSADKNYLYDTAGYTASINATQTWTTIRTWTITLDEDSLVFINAKLRWKLTGGDSSYNLTAIRLRANNATYGNRLILGSHEFYYSTTEPETINEYPFIAYLPAGTWNLILEYWANYATNAALLGYTFLSIGKARLSDAQIYGNLTGSSGSIAAGGTVTIFNQTVPALTPRKTLIGQTKDKVLALFVYAENDPSHRNIIIPWQSGDATNIVYIRPYVDGALVPWTHRVYDTHSQTTYNQVYSCSGVIILPLKGDVNHTVRVDVTNGTSTPTNGVTYGITAVVCPWISPADYVDAVAIDIPLGSTFYVVTEPLLKLDQTKYVAVKKVTHFKGSEVISETSGTGDVVSISYTPEYLEELYLSHKGLWNVLSRLMADLRGG